MMRVRVHPMTGPAIADGDLVVIRQQESAENGEIVAAWLTGTAPAKLP
jgi:repressor LexA